MEFALDNIFGNIKKHYNKDKKKPVRIWFAFSVDGPFIYFSVLNTGTIDKAKKENGCLQQINKELAFFDGELSCDFEHEIKEVKFKFMSYE